MSIDLDLDSPLAVILGTTAAKDLATHLDLHTVGELVRHYPRRYLERGQLSEISGMQLGEHATLVARVESTTMRQMRHRHGQMMAVVLRDDRGGRLDATFFNPHKLRAVLKPGVRALFAGQVGQFRGNCSSPTRSSSRWSRVTRSDRSCRSTRPPPSCRRRRSAVRPPGVGRARRPHRSAARGPARGRGPGRAGTGAASDPCARVGRRPPGRAAPAGLGRGDGRAARAGPAPAGHGVAPGTGLPADAGRAAGRLRRPAAVHPDRGAGRGGRGDRRRPGRRRTR